MQIDASPFEEGIVLTVRESRIDAACALQFKDRFRDLAADGAGKVILDLAMVDFLDSSGLGAVIASMKSLGPDRSLELAALTPLVRKVFRLTHLDTVMTIHPDAASAVSGADAAP
ncbi:MAG: STAS domain-containing protein [Rhodobacteraceae bacterium]|nr:STAS domain-containing protein [Paracoccaceae bacterium]